MRQVVACLRGVVVAGMGACWRRTGRLVAGHGRVVIVVVIVVGEGHVAVVGVLRCVVAVAVLGGESEG